MPSLHLPVVIGSSVKTIAKTIGNRVASHTSPSRSPVDTLVEPVSSDEEDNHVYDKGEARRDIGYDLGWALIKNFIEQSTRHTVEELQDFVTLLVPAPHSIRRIKIKIPSEFSIKAAELLMKSDPSLAKLVGGETWWQWRPNESNLLNAEWISPKRIWEGFKNDKPEEEEQTVPTLFFIHGGGFFFGSLDTHRYQIQRMARKANARAFTVAYRLAPQYPFPCALMDCLASYLYLTEPNESQGILHKPIPPKKIIIAGDSAGGNLAVSLLCLLRDLGKELPSSGILISPWVDLVHSFPSVLENTNSDIFPQYGFVYQPSDAWPPPKQEKPQSQPESQRSTIVREEGEKPLDQVQMYAPNKMLNHPLVSPIYHTSLGGLCPLLIIASDYECLRDEIVYFAHRAAHPEQYPLTGRLLERNLEERKEPERNFPPTLVHLQVYDSTCHIFTVMGWTSPAKYCYRTMGNFCRFIQQITYSAETEALNEDSINSCLKKAQGEDANNTFQGIYPVDAPLKRPEFSGAMIRERVDVKGKVRPLEDPEKISCLQKPEALEGYMPDKIIERFHKGRECEPDPKHPHIRSTHIDKMKNKYAKAHPNEQHELDSVVARLLETESPPPSAMAGRIDVKEGFVLATAIQQQLANGLSYATSTSANPQSAENRSHSEIRAE